MKNKIIINNKKLIIVSALFFIIVCFMVCFLIIKNVILDNKMYKQTVETKEEMFEMLLENRTEYQKMVVNLNTKFVELDKKVLLIQKKEEYKVNGIDDSLARKYPINSIGVLPIDDGVIRIRFYFKYPPKPYSYWGIEYRDNGEPPTWGLEKSLEEENGIYTEVGSFYKFETEKITDNWYYFQCWSR